MNASVYTVKEQMKEAGAAAAAQKLIETMTQTGEARLLLSTGASQFELLDALIKKEIDWSKVTVFHLDEYIGLSETHPASFRKYLKERFAVNYKQFFFINGDDDIERQIKLLSEAIREKPIDIGLIGIGENAHIAFNDPPADFETKEAYHVVSLTQSCKQQQVGEGWFGSLDEVPKQAISITPYQIMLCKRIVSFVPDERKARAIFDTLSCERPTPLIPASLLKNHKDCHLILDEGSSSLLDKNLREKNKVTVY